MDILGLLFSASLFQPADHPSPLEKDDSRTKSPTGDISKPMRKKLREASKCIKCQENPSDQGRSRKSSAYLNDCSRELADVSNTRPLPLSHDEPAKRTSKKKKKRKGKSNKLHLGNNIASETVLSKISLSSELVEYDHSNTTVCNQNAKEAIGKSIHDKFDAKLGRISLSSESTLNGSNHFLNTADTECFPNISKLSLEIATFQDPATGNKNIDNSCNKKFARNQEKSIERVGCSSIITSVTPSDPMGVFLEDASGSYIEPASAVSSSLDSSNLIGAHIEPGNDMCRDTETCEKGQYGSSFVTERSDTQNEGTSDTSYCITISNTEESYSKSVTEDSRSCYKNLHISLGTEEVDRYGSRKEVNSANEHSKICDNPAIVTVQNSFGVKGVDGKNSKMEVTSSNQYSGVKCNSEVSNSTSWIPVHMNYRNKTGKENVNFTWKRTGRYIGSSSTDGRSISDQNHLPVDSASSGTISVSKQSSSKVDSPLPPPHTPHYGRDGIRQKVGFQKSYKTEGSTSIRAYEWPIQGSFRGRHGQYRLRPRNHVMGTGSLERSKTNLILPSNQEYANQGVKESGVGNPNQCEPATRTICSHETKATDGAETTSIDGLKPELSYASWTEEDKTSVCCGIEPHYDTDEFTSRASLPKWIPVSKTESLMLKMGDNVDHKNAEEVHHKQDLGTFSGASCVLDITRDAHMSAGLSNGAQQGSLEKDFNDYCSASDYKLKNFPMCICSDMAEHALKVSYATKISSESFQLATGTPIAEFEKLLSSASPVIPSSSFLQHSDDPVKHEPVSDSFIKFLKPNIALHDIWKWYEEPGNYGLQVKAEDTKGLQANVQFHAHFVPFLSAIQLFGRPYHSVGSCSESTSMPERSDTDECLCPSSASSSLCLPDDSHVIFEYFEHEPPQLRKTLFAKIKELLEVGTSKPQVFGDPSKLECLDVQDLHPASWYSVAWYPIYRIPEGGFRASFLTYHSLGHFCLKGTESDSIGQDAFCAVFPVLGMQNYNTQGECWFYPKKPAENLLKDYKPADVSQLLKERLKTLEETAALFSRGHVQRDCTIAANRHPDYKFFLSRKR